MNDDFLIECIEYETENSTFDFKKEIYDFGLVKCKEDFLIDIVSFGNSHIEGDKYIITGVKLNKDGSRTLNGIDISKAQDGSVYQSIINDNIEPNIIIDFKILNYKDANFGIFCIKKENNDQPYMFSKQYNTISKGFLKIRKGEKNEYASRRDYDIFYSKNELSNLSDIKVRGIIDGVSNEHFKLLHFEEQFNIVEVKELIKSLYEKINTINIIKKEGLKFGSIVNIAEKDIECIKKYSNINNIELKEDFFEIGNLYYFAMPHMGTNYYGTNEEKEKYSLLCNLSDTIKKFNDIQSYYEELNQLYYIELSIENFGKKYDEDIEVKIKIHKTDFIDYDKLPIPGENIIDNVIENKVEKYISIEKSNGINECCSKYPPYQPAPPIGSFSSLYGYSKPSYESSVIYYNEIIKSISNYHVIEDNEYIYITFEQKEIKPNEVISFPSKIFVSSTIDKVEYEIKTKHNPNIKKGIITKKA